VPGCAEHQRDASGQVHRNEADRPVALHGEEAVAHHGDGLREQRPSPLQRSQPERLNQLVISRATERPQRPVARHATHHATGMPDDYLATRGRVGAETALGPASDGSSESSLRSPTRLKPTFSSARRDAWLAACGTATIAAISG